ncbi:FAD-dependent monooxygenase [Facilibium subflavum]|uniref:FAD-dependent monooxygenase n=1 Tax=Facilibium subflavum TaxID=2219058 RepID=UPI000E65A54C|nr:FAD-dependent monooxygenase [Facilibium subflavum]
MKFDVVVVGGGMVGLSCAVGLRLHDLNVAVIEASGMNPKNPVKVPGRVSAINNASKHLLMRLGVWQDIVNSAISPYHQMSVFDQNAAANLSFNAADIAASNLGYIIENDIIINCLQSKAKRLGVDLLDNEKIIQIEQNSQNILTLASGKKLITPLIIGADGANSFIRQHFQFPFDTKAYGHSAIVATLQTQKPHQQTAYQWFTKTGILAFLPLPDANQVSIVYSQNTDESAQSMKEDNDIFEVKLAKASNHQLGCLQLLNKRQSFPLVARHAKHYYQKGVVLIGDAAHTIHPLAGQGVNLGFADVAALVKVIAEAKERHRDYAHISTLSAFERERHFENKMMLYSMKAIKEIFGSHNLLLKSLRGIGVNLVDRTSWLKRFFIHQAMGE